MSKNVLLCLFLISFSSSGFTLAWKDFFASPNQQGRQLLFQGKFAEAAARFQDASWQGVAYYRAQEYDKAQAAFAHARTAVNLYNQGNAFAKKGDYPSAIKVYEQALKITPHDADTSYNLELVKKLLKNNPPSKPKENSSSNKSNSSPPPSGSQGNNGNNDDKNSKNSSSQNQKDKDNVKDKQDKSANTSANNQTPPSKAPPPSSSNEQAAQQGNTKNDPNHRQMNRWLSQVPDDPGGLLRQKFRRDYARMQSER